MIMQVATASCVCGECHVKVTADPVQTVASAAPSSQIACASPVRWLAHFAEDKLVATGPFLAYRYAPGDGLVETQWRCATCGTPMWFRSNLEVAGTIGVNAAAFGAPSDLVPNQIASPEHLPDWLQINTEPRAPSEV
jgi:hypothetical protein